MYEEGFVQFGYGTEFFNPFFSGVTLAIDPNMLAAKL